ncbi:MAG TPA: alkaline phosphatase family protein [Thermoanaerobaculia bacterium]
MRRPLVLLLLFFLACAPASIDVETGFSPSPVGLKPDTTLRKPGTTLRKPGTTLLKPGTTLPRRVVLITFDGLGADALSRQSNLPAFAHLARTGAVARVIPVNPTLTGPTHVSILTGADPQTHGVVSNWFHLPGTPPEKVTRGIEVDPEVETLVEAARRQGKRVGAVSFPTMDATTPRRTADFGVAWTTPLTRGRIVQLSRADFKREWVPPTWTARPQRRTSYSPIMRARVEWTATRTLRTDVDVVAYDTTNDRRENYDVYTIELSDRELELDARGWFAVSRENHGSWSKILGTTPSLDVKLYWGAISRTNAYPESYRAMLDAEAGFWPGAADEQSDIDPATFAEQLERLTEFLTRAQTLTLQRMQFDLLLAYQPVIDATLHNFIGTNDEVIRRAYAAADRAAASVGSQLDAGNDALLIMGDHGLVPIDRTVRLNAFLTRHGFAPRWRAYTANNVAHLYRFSGEDDADIVSGVLQSTGWFERIEKKQHRNSGDLIATSHPGISLSDSFDEPVEGKPNNAGHHGALNTHRELHAAFFASGRGVTPGNVGEVPQTEIAAFVKGLLGLPSGPPASSPAAVQASRLHAPEAAAGRRRDSRRDAGGPLSSAP